MSFFAILLALIVEQVRSMPESNIIYKGLRTWLTWVLKNFDANNQTYARICWALITLVPTILVAAIHWALLLYVGWVATLIWSVIVLYCTFGFRQFSHHFTVIRDALWNGDIEKAQKQLADWGHVDANDLSSSETIKSLIEHSLLNAQRCVFGVLAWYCIGMLLGLGPTGAVFYRISGYVSQKMKYTSSRKVTASQAFQATESQLWYLIDWVPVRLSVLGFAFVGSFEEAIDASRKQQAHAPRDNDALLLASASGAINVQLGTPTIVTNSAPAEVQHLRAVVGLVWRMVVMWMVILALLSLAKLMG